MDEKEFKSLLETCRISLEEGEERTIKKDIDEVIEYFNRLDTIECGDTKPAFHPIDIPEKLRKDEVKEFEDVDGVLKNTATYRSYVIGPKV